MNCTHQNAKKSRWLSLSALALAASLSWCGDTMGELVLQNSFGSTTYAVYKTGAGSGSGTFISDVNNPNYGLLNYAGGGLPAITTQTGSSQTTSASSLSPYFLSSANAGSVPSNFGTATTEVYAANSGQEGSFTTQGGVYWSLKTKLADDLGAGANLASVSYSSATATYYNSGNTTTINPGAILSIAGTLGSSTGFVAAGLYTTITLSFGEGATTYELDPIILAANGSGTEIASKGGSNPNEFASLLVEGNAVIGAGTSLVASPFTIYGGETVMVTSYLTLISDPGSKITITDNLPSGLTEVPDFGAFASSPSIVPEPSTIALCGSGLIMTVLWTRSRRSRTAPGA